MNRQLAVEPLEDRRLLSMGPPLLAASLPYPPASTIIYEEHFENGPGGYTPDNSGGTMQGLWHYSLGRRGDGLPGHTPNHNWYYGLFETARGFGRYDVAPFDHQGTLTSPVLPSIPFRGKTTLFFNYFLETRGEPDRDFAEVRIVINGVQSTILSRADNGLRETNGQWLPASYKLDAFAGKTFQLQFFFNTADPPRFDPEGWYVDDVVIVNEPDPISGYKWDDQDHDGVWDSGEPGLNGWTIYLDRNGNNKWDQDQGEESFVTRNDGQHDGAYWFADLPAGKYTVREVLKEGWKQSYPAESVTPPFEHVVTIDPSAGVRVNGGWEKTEPPNFGNFEPDISGYKWDDRIADGVWDADGADNVAGTPDDEEGLNGWIIYIDQ
ncbi:MAG: hypothetical protein HUU20_01840, partial [Pirellulales bacterium]|nr:hypothetical protein [Pirellulales bacterium]